MAPCAHLAARLASTHPLFISSDRILWSSCIPQSGDKVSINNPLLVKLSAMCQSCYNRTVAVSPDVALSAFVPESVTHADTELLGKIAAVLL